MPFATVYRDDHGMPHIVAGEETLAWYALGYEQARDALLWIQYACKAAKGELTWVRGVTGITNDVAVKVFNAHGRLAAMSVAQRQALFAPVNPNIQANFYDNCVAFAAGADAYRQAVKYAPPAPSPPALPTPERALHDWLDRPAPGFGQSTFAWVYEHPIEAVDIAAQGAWTTAFMSFRWPSGLVNSWGSSYGLLPGAGVAGEIAPEPPANPLAPGNAQRLLDELRQQLSVLGGAPSGFSGSSTFAWSGLYCHDASPGTTSYAGLLGDPHQPVPAPAPNFPQAFMDAPNHLWVAHVQVKPPGASQPTLDILGHVPHAAAAFFTGHNRSVAMGGTLGGPNHFDTFLLRLQEDPATGAPQTPHAFYSYYHDSSINPSNTTWRPITAHTITVKRPDNTGNYTLPYWRADSFGLILPSMSDVTRYVVQGGTAPVMPFVFGERVDPNLNPPAPRWRVSIPQDPERMRFWSAPQRDGSNQLLTSPMVVTLRAPMDAAVAGEDMHWQLLRDFWEIGHAAQVQDVIGRTNGAAYTANVCFVDRQGSTFSTQFSAIPQRGNDAQLGSPLYHYHTLDKYLIYSKALPVPARHYADTMFDWKFGGFTNPAHPAPLLYLQYPATSPPGTSPFKPMTLQDPITNNAFPPSRPSTSGTFQIESGFFTSACNDQIWGFSRKRDFVDISGSAFNNVVFLDLFGNQLLQWVLDAGVAYQTWALSFEAPTHQQFVVEQFTRQAERIIRGGSAGLPPLTPAQMRAFVVSPEVYHDASYVPPVAGVTANPALPTPIRQLKEVVDNPAHSSSPLFVAQKELNFFTDLWGALFSPRWDNHQVAGASPPLTVSLRDLWVNGNVAGHQNQIFWYDDPTNATNPGLRWIDLPPDFPLIDFYWPGTDVSRNVTTETLYSTGPLSNGEVGTLGSLVTQLVNWDPAGPHYRNVPTSPGACLLEMMRMGYNAQTVPNHGDFGRHWVRLKRGQVEYSSSGWTSLTSSGGLPGGGTLARQDRPWDALRNFAFPGDQLATLFRPVGPPVPTAALYDPVTGQVRTILGPAETNELVKFFLELGNNYIDPQHNGGNPSRKLARFQHLLNYNNNNNSLAEAAFLASLPATYPLTDGLQRLTVPRALLDTGAYLQSLSPSGIPAYSQCFRARAYDHYGQRWPSPPPPPQTSDADCVGGGGPHAVTWNEDVEPGSGRVPFRGFQPKFLGLSGSISTLLALFPSNRNDVDSYFWCTPGIEVMTSDPARFNAHMNAFATNTLLPTHYDDFLNFVAWSVVHEY